MINPTVKTGETKEAYRKRMTFEMKAEARRKRAVFERGEIPVVMDVDDFAFLLPGYDDLLRLKNSFADFKITAFTIPLPKEFYNSVNAKHFTKDKYQQWAKVVRDNPWIEVAIHGFSHTHNEFDVGYDQAIKMLTAIENYFEQMGVRYSKIFKAPYWQYSYDALVALRDKGYVVAIDRNHQRPVPDGLKTYVYNWSFEEPLPEADIIKGHGHFTGQNTNNISATLANICHHLPKNTRFLTIGEYLAELTQKENGK